MHQVIHNRSLLSGLWAFLRKSESLVRSLNSSAQRKRPSIRSAVSRRLSSTLSVRHPRLHSAFGLCASARVAPSNAAPARLASLARHLRSRCNFGLWIQSPARCALFCASALSAHRPSLPPSCAFASFCCCCCCLLLVLPSIAAVFCCCLPLAVSAA